MAYPHGIYGRPPARRPLDGTGLLADDLYLIAHHERTGRPYLAPRPLGVALAGAMVAELMVSSRPLITLDRGYLLLVGTARDIRARWRASEKASLLFWLTQVVSEPVQRHVITCVLGEWNPMPVGDWLRYLGRDAVTRVAGRLAGSGHLTRPASRIPWRSAPLAPRDPDAAACALLRARRALDANRQLGQYPALLAGFALAAGLEFRFAGFPRTRDIATATAPLGPPLQELIACVQGAAEAAVLSPRP